MLHIRPGHSIFVVDDDVPHGRALSKLLSSNGYSVKTFESASRLMDAKHELEACDLVISDINMPGMSGLDLCRALRSQGSLGRIPIILITGSDPNLEKADGIEAGADDFIGKPFRSAELLAKVRSLLEIRTKEIATHEELQSSKGLNGRLQNLQRFLSPNVANLLTKDSIQQLLKPHRAEVSVFFIDLRGFTAFSERCEPEEVLEVLSAYYTAVGSSAIKHNGTLGHLAGDGIMVFFNDPEPIPDHRETAVQMAIEVRESLIAQRQIWRERQYEIDFGMGISEGFATIGEIGFDRFSQYSVIGPVTNFAARLCNAAVDGQILVSQRFNSKLKHGIYSVESLGDLQFKGLERTISVYNILSKDMAQKKPDHAA